jgi:hypothetical protein
MTYGRLKPWNSPNLGASATFGRLRRLVMGAVLDGNKAQVCDMYKICCIKILGSDSMYDENG